MVRTQRLGAGVLAGVLLLGVWGGPSWAEEPTDLVVPSAEQDPTDAEAPESDDPAKESGDDGQGFVPDGDRAEGDPVLQGGAAGLGGVPLDQGENEPEALTLETPPELVAEFALSPMEAKPGGQVRFSGKCLMHGNPGDSALVVAYWANEAEDMDLQKVFSLRTSVINDDGTFDQLLTIPLDATPGVYDIPEPSCGLQDQMWLGSGDGSAELGTFTVLTDGVLPPPVVDGLLGDPEVPVLAETGGNGAVPLLVVAGVCFLAGAMVLVRRKRVAF